MQAGRGAHRDEQAASVLQLLELEADGLVDLDLQHTLSDICVRHGARQASTEHQTGLTVMSLAARAACTLREL